VCVWHFFSSSHGDMLYVAWGSYTVMTVPGEERCSKQIKSSALCGYSLLVTILVPWCRFSLNHKATEVKGKNFLHFSMVKLLRWCHQLWDQCRVSCVLCNLEVIQKHSFSIFSVLLAVK